MATVIKPDKRSFIFYAPLRQCQCLDTRHIRFKAAKEDNTWLASIEFLVGNGSAVSFDKVAGGGVHVSERELEKSEWKSTDEGKNTGHEWSLLVMTDAGIKIV